MKEEIDAINKKSKKAKIIIFSIMLALFGAVSLSYGWVAQWIVGEKYGMEIRSTAFALGVSYGGSYPQITAELAPGESVVKTYEITNYDENNPSSYNIKWTDVDNMFFPYEGVHYTLYVEDEEGIRENIVERSVLPNNNVSVSQGLQIGAGSKKIITLIITYDVTDENQEEGYGKYFAGNIAADLDAKKDFNSFIEVYKNGDIDFNFYRNQEVPNSNNYKYIESKSYCTNGVTLDFDEINGEFSTPDTFVTTYCRAYFLSYTNLAYTGSYQTFIASQDGYYEIEAKGAKGGGSTGGYGEDINSFLYLEEGETIYVYVGGQGGSNAAVTNTGGYNGGGYSGNNSVANSYGGGGATDIRCFADSEGKCAENTENLAWNDSLGLKSRILVAAGGGGGISTSESQGGLANGLVGGSGTTSITSYNNETYLPTGGKQNSSGYAYENQTRQGLFGYAIQSNTVAYGGGGGSGYYGGSNGYGTTGSAGSSYISGYAGVNAIESDGNHTNNTLHYSNKYFVNSTMKSSINNTNGSLGILYYGAKEPERVNITLNKIRYVKDCINGNSTDNTNKWSEIEVIVDGENILKGKQISSEENINYITDGITNDGNYYEQSDRCIVIDLKKQYDIDEIAVWHYYNDARIYYDNYTYTSQDGENWFIAINNQKFEDENGKRENAWNVPDHTIIDNKIDMTESFTLANRVKEGYTLEGWYTDIAFTNKKGNVNQIVTKGEEILYAKWEPITYEIEYDYDEETVETNNPTVGTYNQVLTISNLEDTDLIFGGWNITGMDSSNHVIGTEVINATSKSPVDAERYINLISTNGKVKFTAIWSLPEPREFAYTGGVQSYNVLISGMYKLEVWGAQGGRALCNGGACNSNAAGGYSVGAVFLTKKSTIYVVVGGAGCNGSRSSNSCGGYNGGGSGTWDYSDDEAAGGGGGATHMATTNRGTLVNYNSYREEVLIVAGGGGGSCWSYGPGTGGGTGGGCSFGQGSNGSGTGDSDGVPGGGGGWSGGCAGGYKYAAGGGSGYIGGVESYGDVTARTTNAARSGHGYAKITYIGKREN